MQVSLSQPIHRLGGPITVLQLRPPGRRVVEAMTAARLPAGFTEATIVKFGSRLSGVAEQHLRALSERDLHALRAAVEASYLRARRRYAARAAIVANDKESAGSTVVREALDGRR